jgi:peptide/nickel transport system substrate-binding protein
MTYNRGNEYSFMFNLTHPDPVMREIFNDIRFREAMSLAIDRDEINELVYFGLATPSQAAPTPDSLFYEPWMTDYYAQFDPDQANQLLDEMGLDKRDSDGYRLRPDGQTLFINLQVSVPEESWQKIAELVTSYWNDVGVKTNFKLIEIGLYNEIRNAGTQDVAAWALDITDIGDVSTNLNNLRPTWGARYGANQWQTWFNTDGADGMEPPDEIKELWDLAEQYLAAPYLSDEQITLGKEFYTKSFQGLYQIGTIQRPPQPLLFKQDLKNTPPSDTQGLWSWDYRQWVMFMPEQWFYAPQ